MKYLRFLTIVFMVMVTTVSVSASKNIKLNGCWNQTERSLVNGLPIHAWVEDNKEQLSLFFDSDLGYVSVKITDPFGTILYNQVLNTDKSSSFIIPIKDIERECVLSITDSKNTVYGQFSIN